MITGDILGERARLSPEAVALIPFAMSDEGSSAVAEVSVVEMIDEKWGEVPVAFVALKASASASDLELVEFLRPRINKIKLLRQVIFIEGLSRNAYGKVLKLELQDRLRNLKSSAADGSGTVTPERISS